MPALSLLKKYGISKYNMLVELITAEEMTEAEFIKKQAEAEKKPQGVQA